MCSSLPWEIQRTVLLVDLSLDVEVDAGDDDIGEDVERAHAVENIGVVKGHSLGDLHESPTIRSAYGPQRDRSESGSVQDNDEVRPVFSLAFVLDGSDANANVHLRVERHCDGLRGRRRSYR